MIAALISLLSGGLLKLLLQAYESRLKAKTSQEALSADLAAEEIRAEISARAEARKVLVAENGVFFSAGRLGRLSFVLPLGLWWSAICLDSVFHFGWKVAEVPVLRDWGGAIVTSLFLVDGVKSVGRMWQATR
ncbi:hypothetical protein J0X15_08140 [Roseibium sp. CAU 1637]|uniref:Uncharacterized protein n=1 Tax=Roseibium limicola TaxID=2816037 RepID=A0A939J8C9_9HYPH|nr:hypothetical protein [Roseibium limicola]MBO0345186.1 hypothetical protein [Roseibium limicola]